ncbi:hypothetical protein BMS3Bbin04_01892 [bacterium BMS3Bbin04]|nr:hypothetical protein BMS3Bbin04_01892 [bacterium BMS3Bbin04]
MYQASEQITSTFFYSVFVILITSSLSFAQHGMPTDHPAPQQQTVVEETSVLPTVESVLLAIKTASGDTLPEIEVLFGIPKTIPNTEYQLKVSDFHTHWKWKDRPINKSFEELNPAVKVEVFDTDSLLYYQWAFQNIPFFGLQNALGHSEDVEKGYGFTLINYTGLVIPEDSISVDTE